MSGIDRVDLLRQSTSLTGMDFVQVSADQQALLLFFLHPTLPPAVLAALTGLDPTQVSVVADGAVIPERVPVLQVLTPLSVIHGRHALRLVLEAPGGFGHYRLSIDDPVLDPYYNGIRFSFKAACPTGLDCAAGFPSCGPEPSIDFPVDYRGRDFWGLRQALLDFAASRYPHWQDRLEADLGMVLVELMSALGDELAYAQDRIHRETRLDTASQRRSLRQLARLVDYAPDEGSGARAWLDIQANAPGALVGGTTRVADALGRHPFEVGHGIGDQGTAFQVAPARNELLPYRWDENQVCLPRGSTTLTLSGAHAASLVPDPAIDPLGKWVLLATRPTDPALPVRNWMARVVQARDGADPLLGQPVTEIQWDQPTPFELDLTSLVVRANQVPASSGETHQVRFRIGPAPEPGLPDADLPQALERVGVDGGISYDAPGPRVKFLFSLDGSNASPLVWLGPDGAAMRPEIRLEREGDGPWSWLPSLIGAETAPATAKVFTLEDGSYRTLARFERFGRVTELADYADSDGTTLRFGDGEFGLAPADGSVFRLTYRLGNGRRMNLAAETLTRFATPQPGFVDGVTNPLPATGGRDPEPDDAVRVNAPQAFRALTYRAVRPEDYEDIAERLPWVRQAGAGMRWTGSWPTVFATADPRDRHGLTSDQIAELHQTLDRVRQAGRALEIQEPRYANIDLEIHICTAPNAYRGEVKERVLEALFGKDGQGGYFDPDNHSFGDLLSRAALIAAIQAVPGVAAVDGMRIRRRGWFDWTGFDAFSLPLAPNELLRVTNDPLLPERGNLQLIMEGGA